MDTSWGAVDSAIAESSVLRPCLFSSTISVDPDTLHQPEKEHANHNEGPGITDKWKRDSRDRHDRDAHSYILENMSKEESNHSSCDNLTRKIPAVIGNKEALDKKKRKSAKEKKASSKPLLLGNNCKNIIIMSSLPWDILSVMQGVL